MERTPLGMQLDVNVDCSCEVVGMVDVKCRYLLSLSVHPCESDAEVAGRRGHREEAGQLQRHDPSERKRTFVFSISAMLSEPVALESSTDRSPPPMQAFRQKSAQNTPVIFNDVFELKAEG